MIKNKTAFLNFNKEILIGEIGAILGAQIASYIIFSLTHSRDLASIAAILGSIIGGAILYLPTRYYHQKQANTFSPRKFGKDLLYFTPVALALTILIYYPSLYMFENYFLGKQTFIIFSTFFSQSISFFLFLIAINIYRTAILTIKEKEL
ncbi:hypothetical protein WKV44_08635 [Spirochaetia bacterium 38H-sp]|uniref:GtrA-like protein domain-containing protein n=1 Tax=Rarispira pelagica TaxID=3141764 RepID=A0ABU9UD59_9SPIR